MSLTRIHEAFQDWYRIDFENAPDVVALLPVKAMERLAHQSSGALVLPERLTG